MTTPSIGFRAWWRMGSERLRPLRALKWLYSVAYVYNVLPAH